MRQFLRPLTDPFTYRGWVHALIAAVAAFPVLLVLALALAPVRPESAFWLVFAASVGAVIALTGMPQVARRAGVRLANGLLGTGLPVPSTRRGLATAAWHLVWTAGGVLLMFASLLALISPALALIWFKGGDTVTVLAPVEIRGGLPGAWTLLVAVAGLIALPYLSAGHARLMRRFAVRLLGPSLADRLAAAEAEADRVAARNRLARDLHDSIGHTLTTSAIQAAVARQILASDPEAALLAIGSIEDSSRIALDDLDRALGVLREEPSTPRASPTLADLGLLRDRIDGMGTELGVELEGDLSLVTPAVSQEAFRIVQEGITNALKHAPGVPIQVRVEVTETRLGVLVANEVSGESGGAGRGRGIKGITERVRLLGGKASAGPESERQTTESRGAEHDEPKWILRAELPLRTEHAVE